MTENKKTLNSKELGMAPFNAAMPLTLIDDLKQNFHLAYRFGPINYSNDPLVIPIAAFISAIAVPSNGIDWETNIIDGIVFHYSIYSNTFTYIITKGKFEDGQVKYSGTPYYKQLTTGGFLNPDPNATEFQTRADLYKNTVDIRRPPIFNLIGGIHQLLLHPLRCFYTRREIFKFLSDNNAFTAPASTNLIVVNGAIRKVIDIPSNIETDYKVQSPILYIKDTVLSKQPTDETLNYIKHYLDKGLDIGRLCPPDCT